MQRLFGMLIISLSLLASAIVLQMITGVGGTHIMTVVLIGIPFVIGILLLIPNVPRKRLGDQPVLDEEIEAELMELNKNGN